VLPDLVHCFLLNGLRRLLRAALLPPGRVRPESSYRRTSHTACNLSTRRCHIRPTASCTLDASLTAGPSRSSAPRVSTFRRTPELRPRDGHRVPASRTKVLHHNSSCACRCSPRHTSVSPARAQGPALLRPPNTCTHRQLSRVTACTLASPARRRSHSCRSSTCTGSSARELLHCRNHAAPTPVLARRQFTCIAPHQLMPEPFAPTQLRSSLVRSTSAHSFLLCRPAPARASSAPEPRTNAGLPPSYARSPRSWAEPPRHHRSCATQRPTSLGLSRAPALTRPRRTPAPLLRAAGAAPSRSPAPVQPRAACLFSARTRAPLGRWPRLRLSLVPGRYRARRSGPPAVAWAAGRRQRAEPGPHLPFASWVARCAAEPPPTPVPAWGRRRLSGPLLRAPGLAPPARPRCRSGLPCSAPVAPPCPAAVAAQARGGGEREVEGIRTGPKQGCRRWR
jgi:hypothetical protein